MYTSETLSALYTLFSNIFRAIVKLRSAGKAEVSLISASSFRYDCRPDVMGPSMSTARAYGSKRIAQVRVISRIDLITVNFHVEKDSLHVLGPGREFGRGQLRIVK